MSLRTFNSCSVNYHSIFRSVAPLLIATAVLSTGCSPSGDDPPAISLVQDFGAAEVVGSPAGDLEFPRLEWRFDGEPSLAPAEDGDAMIGWSAFNDIDNLRVEEGSLQGTAGETPILTVAIPENAFPKDRLWAIEVKLRISAGSKLGVDDPDRGLPRCGLHDLSHLVGHLQRQEQQPPPGGRSAP